MNVSDFDYALPESLIAQSPLPERDASRLLVLPRHGGPVDHRHIADLPSLLQPGDLLVVNDARVIPARLHGHKRGSGGKVELLLIEPVLPGEPDWLALAGSSKPLREGATVEVAGQPFQVLQVRGGGEVLVRPPLAGDALLAFLEAHGEVPLPPYIERPKAGAAAGTGPGGAAADSASSAGAKAAPVDDRERYQTVFARTPGAVAAPTAGLHFTPRLLEALSARGVALATVTLHVGPGTFLPVRVDKTEDHRMHRERYEVPAATAAAHAATRARGGRVIALGTTALRTLEAAWSADDPASPGSAGHLRAGPGATDLFVTPGYRFGAVDGLITNFHLPKSTLLMLVAGFAGLERVLGAYREAVERRYRFFSYGDAMLIV